MATKTWKGTTNGTWSTTTNWAEGVAPNNGDTVAYDSSAANHFTDQTVSTSLTGFKFTLGVGSSPSSDIKVAAGSTLNLATTNPAILINASTKNLTIGGSAPLIALAAANTEFQVNGSQSLTINSVVSGSTYGIKKTGAGTYYPLANNIYSGPTTISAGVISVASMVIGTAASPLGNVSNAASNLLFDGGSLYYTGGDTTTDHLFTVDASSGSLYNNGTGRLTFNNPGSIVASGSGNRTLTLGGTANYANIFKPVLSDSTTSGTISLTIQASSGGSWNLTGSNPYTGATTLSSGILQVDGAISASSGLTAASTTTLQGSGTIACGCTLTSATLCPGDGTHYATYGGVLKTGAMTLDSGSTFKLNLNSSYTTTDFSSTGTFTCGSSTLTIASLTSPAYKTYTIVTAAAISGTFNGLPNGSFFSQQGRNWQIKYTGTTITLLDASVTSTTFNSSTTWTCPAGVTSVQAEAWGGGGAGGNATWSSLTVYTNGGGGGGGAYALTGSIATTPSTGYTVTVGTSAVNSSFTGDSSQTIVAAHGTSSSGTSSGAGGTTAASTGDVKYAGGLGPNGTTNNYVCGSGGGAGAGSSNTGANGTIGTNSTTAAGGVGTNGGGSGGQGTWTASPAASVGTQPGGGGGGGGCGDSQGNPGAAGASGRIKLTWLVPAPTNIMRSLICYN